MPLSIQCPSCKSRLRVPEELAGSGKKLKCPKCDRSLLVDGNGLASLAPSGKAGKPPPKVEEKVTAAPAKVSAKPPPPPDEDVIEDLEIVDEEPPPPRRRGKDEEDDGEDEAPRSRPRIDEDEEDEENEAPRSRRSRRSLDDEEDDDEEEERPRRRRRRDGDDDFQRGGSKSDDRTMALFAHLGGIFFGFLPSLVIWLIKKDSSKFVARHAKEALNFQLTLLIPFVLLFVLRIILSFFIGFGFYASPPSVDSIASVMLVGTIVSCFTMLIIFGLGVFDLVCCIRGAIAAHAGQEYQYPWAIRMIH